jgi:hypothetical protein
MKYFAIATLIAIIASCSSTKFKSYCDPLYLDADDQTTISDKK